MTTPIHEPNITEEFYPDSDHYIVSGALRICNILLSYLVESLAVSTDSTEREASGSRRHSECGKFIDYYQRGTRGIRPLPGEYTSAPLDIHGRITKAHS
jgi:hypothetical protein